MLYKGESVEGRALHLSSIPKMLELSVLMKDISRHLLRPVVHD